MIAVADWCAFAFLLLLLGLFTGAIRLHLLPQILTVQGLLKWPVALWWGLSLLALSVAMAEACRPGNRVPLNQALSIYNSDGSVSRLGAAALVTAAFGTLALIWIANHGGLGLRAGGGWGGNAPWRERAAMPGLDIAWLLIVLQLVAIVAAVWILSKLHNRERRRGSLAAQEMDRKWFLEHGGRKEAPVLPSEAARQGDRLPLAPAMRNASEPGRESQRRFVMLAVICLVSSLTLALLGQGLCRLLGIVWLILSGPVFVTIALVVIASRRGQQPEPSLSEAQWRPLYGSEIPTTAAESINGAAGVSAPPRVATPVWRRTGGLIRLIPLLAVLAIFAAYTYHHSQPSPVSPQAISRLIGDPTKGIMAVVSARTSHLDRELNRGGDAYARHRYEEALLWYRKAAAGGSMVAMDQIGTIYALGGNGVVQSYSKAMAWYLKGAQTGSGAALYNIGRLYQHGRGVPQSREMAILWFKKAISAGYAPAQRAIKRLAAPTTQDGAKR